MFQCLARRIIAQRKIERMREDRAAVTLQKYLRRYSQRKRFLEQKVFVVMLQTVIRARFARTNFEFLRKTAAALKIQKLFRGWSVRSEYNRNIRRVVLIQSCVRRRRARKELKQLKLEARSVSHFKEVSYNLENKVVKLTQDLSQQKDEKKALTQKANVLEAQVRSWIEKYEKMEQKARDLDLALQKPTVPKSQFEQLQSERDSLHSTYLSSLDKIKVQDQEVARLSQELTKQKDEVTKLRVASQQPAKPAEEPADVAAMKQEIAALKAELSRKINTPRRQNSVASLQPRDNRGISPNGRGISPIREPVPLPTERERIENGLSARDGSSSRRGKSPTGLSRRTRRNSSAEPYETSKSKPKTSIDIMMQQETIPHPRHVSTSFDHLDMSKILGQGKGRITEEFDGDMEEEIIVLLEDKEPMQEEVLDGLIKTLKLPLPSLQNPPSQKEIFFPAHLIGLAVQQMWKLGFIPASEQLLFNVMDGIQKQCLSFTGDEAVVPCAYWLSNVHELLSLICVAERDMEQDTNFNMTGGRAFGWHDFEKLVSTIKYEMQCLEDNIFHAWMKELKKRLNKMVIPAVIESQSLPGFITSDSGRFFNKLLTGSSQPAFSMDDLLNFLNKVWRAMKCYFVEPSVVRQVLTELLKLVGVTSFNDLLMRRSFCSWKRAMQIQYNITRIEEWCKSHDIPEGTLQLEHLMQATKLLQLKKASLSDIEIIYDVCWMLTPTQIQKLISHYFVADYENPISPEILKAVASRVVSGDKNDILLLDAINMDETTSPFEIPIPRDLEVTQKYLPSWLNLQQLRKLTYLVTLQEQNAAAKKE